jgi:hypothetical protein
MEANRIALIGLSILLLTTTTIALAQNTSNPMLSGNTTNPVLSGNTVSQGPQIPVSPTLNTTILAPLLGRNSFTGLLHYWEGIRLLVCPALGRARWRRRPARAPLSARHRQVSSAHRRRVKAAPGSSSK